MTVQSASICVAAQQSHGGDTWSHKRGAAAGTHT